MIKADLYYDSLSTNDEDIISIGLPIGTKPPSKWGQGSDDKNTYPPVKPPIGTKPPSEWGQGSDDKNTYPPVKPPIQDEAPPIGDEAALIDEKVDSTAIIPLPDSTTKAGLNWVLWLGLAAAALYMLTKKK
jgi:hypothetical protein